MNQFKKAKLRQMEAGQEVESVNGLQTTGIQDEDKDKSKNKEIDQTNTNEVTIQNEQNQPVQNISSTKEEIVQNTSLEKIIEETLPEKIEENEEEIKETITVVEETPIPTPVPVVVNRVEPQIIQEQIQTVYEPVVQKVEIPKIVTKKVPNIFIQKEESKSVRKSLVLKPSSVKKAENYCVKNGGSFNELVQHLLDDFIDAYGL